MNQQKFAKITPLISRKISSNWRFFRIGRKKISGNKLWSFEFTRKIKILRFWKVPSVENWADDCEMIAKDKSEKVHIFSVFLFGIFWRLRVEARLSLFTNLVSTNEFWGIFSSNKHQNYEISWFWIVETFHMLWKTRKNLTHLILTRFFYQQKANFPCFFIKANLYRTRNLNCYLLFKLYFQSFSFLNFWNILVVWK